MQKKGGWQYSTVLVSLLIQYQVLDHLLVITEVTKGSNIRSIVEHHLAMNRNSLHQ